MRKHHEFMQRVCVTALVLTFSAVYAPGQPAPLASHQEPILVDSGFVRNNAAFTRTLDPGVRTDMSQPLAVFVTEVRVPGASWLRLNFQEVLLSGDAEDASGSYLQITSVLDGAQQRLNAEHVAVWSNTSAYFNGDTVIVELYSYPDTGDNRLLMTEITAGEPQPESICGLTDDRLPSGDARQGKLVPTATTAWLIDMDGCGNWFLTDGHSLSGSGAGIVVWFNVPYSTASGTPVAPGPEDQYPLEVGSVQSTGAGGAGNDAATFKSVANTTTGLTPREAQGGGAYFLASAAPPAGGQDVRITGYGGVNAPISPNWNSIQKSHVGSFTTKDGTRLEYRVDTTGGNDGSPIVDQTTGDAIGIHTHDGCTSTGGANMGTAIEHPELQSFLASPLGTFLPMDVNCIQTLFAGDDAGSVGGAVYFDITPSVEIEIVGMHLNAVDVMGTPFTVDIYTTPSTYVGKETDPFAWTLVASGSGVSGGPDAATPVKLDKPITLEPVGPPIGMAMVMDGAAHRYTTGARSYSNTELQLDLGSATDIPFATPVFNPRVWNGTICYNVVPPPPCTAIQINYMTVPSSLIEMDSLPVGPVTVPELNLAGTPGPAILSDVKMPDKPTSSPGVYNTNNHLGQALARVNGEISIIEGASGTAPFDPAIYDYYFGRHISQMGFEVGDWNGSMDVKLYDGEELQAEVTTSTSPLYPTPQFVQIESGCAFNRVTIDASSEIANFVITELWTEAQAPCPCACNFDTSTGAGVCDIVDFTIFAGLFAGSDPCACDMDTSTGPGVCDIVDFTIFAGQFAAGCP